MMFELSRTHRLIMLGVAVPSTACLLYWLIRSARDDDGDYEEEIDSRKSMTAATSRQTVIEVAIPSKAVGSIIGRQGANIKKLQEQCGAKMNFKDDSDRGDDSDRTLIIRGTVETAQAAEITIRQLLADMPVVIQGEMHVPQYALGRIIGKGGESIRQIQMGSNARIFIDRGRESAYDHPRLVSLSGSQASIDIAKSMIKEKLDEEEEFRAKQASSAANRETRNSKSHPAQANGGGDATWVPLQEGMKQLTFPNVQQFVEVYVAAIANPDHFWVQLIGQMALKLDELSEEMTRYYSTTGTHLAIADVKKGDIIAAPFENDNTWYRAKIMEITETKLDVFYVDYGDSAYVDITKVRELNYEYLDLPFQAIECRLDGLEPPTNGQWGDEMFDTFEELTHCAKWKVLVARLVRFVDERPSLTLVDTNNEEDIDIAEELVRRQLAVAMVTNDGDN